MKFSLVPGFLAALGALAQGSSLVITPPRPVVTQGRTLKISVSQPSTFTLTGAGSLSMGSGTSVVYRAPAHLQPQHTLSGCPVVPGDSIYNTPIDQLPVHANSDVWTPYAMYNGVNFEYAWGTNVVASNMQGTPQEFYYTSGLNGTSFPVPPAGSRKREQGAYTTNGNQDHHMLVLSSTDCKFYETYQEGEHAVLCPTCTAQSGYMYASVDYKQPESNYGGGTTDAAGLPLAPLTLHLSEIQDGAVRHALRFTVCPGCVSGSYIWPATSSTGGSPLSPPMGTRFRLKASYDVSPYPKSAQIVLNAMKQYGLFLADIGTSGVITASTDVTERPDVVAELQTIQQAYLSASNFEAVDESSLMLNNGSHEVNPKNPYVVPQNQALLTITPVADPASAVTLPIVLNPVAVGTQDPNITVQAGTPAFKINAWVHGAAQQLAWSIEPSTLGSFDAQGRFTVEQNAASLQTGVITVASIVDPTALANITVNVLPNGPIHIDSGSSTATFSEDGTQWLPDLAFETGSFAAIQDNYPSGMWGGIRNSTQTESFMYTWGADIVYRMHVPNGNYKITFLTGVGGCTGQYSNNPGGGFLLRSPLILESQGVARITNWDPGAQNNHTCRVPSSMAISASVTDTRLEVAMRSNGDANTQSLPLLNGLSIEKQ